MQIFEIHCKKFLDLFEKENWKIKFEKRLELFDIKYKSTKNKERIMYAFLNI